MSHPQQQNFIQQVKNKFPNYFENVSVIEIGSLNINGTVRGFFNATKYVGVDLAEGNGVDLVKSGHEVDFSDNSFDVAISTECFEHNPYWIETFNNMHRMAKSFVVFTCASGNRPEHGTKRSDPSCSPFTLEWDYYKNLNEEDFRNGFNLDNMFSDYAFSNEVPDDLYFWGIKNI